MEDNPEKIQFDGVVNLINEHYELGLSTDEKNYLAYILMTLRKQKVLNNEMIISKMSDIIAEIYEKIERDLFIDLSGDKELTEGLSLHIYSTIHRRSFTENDFVDYQIREMRKKYPLGYEMATIAAGVIAIMLVIFVLFKVAMPKFKILQKLIDRLNLVTREILTGLSVIRAFSTEKHEEERFDKANMDLMKTNLFVNRAMTFMMPTMMLVMNGLTVLIVYVGASNIDAGKMQVGDLMAFIQYAMQIIMAFLFISMVSIMMPRAQVAAERVNEILDMEVMIKDPEEPKPFLPEKKGEVEFKNVYFCYPDADEAVLHNISFTAPAGKTTAFIGSTGSGKSTLVNLIPRFFDVSRGSILVDGVDIRDVKQHDLCEKIGYVPQKGVLFSGTIESNLKYGKEDATMDEVKRAARIAQATDFIEEKEEQYDSPIAQGGSNVSGGQKQRLSIARAVAKDPEIYIFDDSFSALDYKTDVKLRAALQEETHGSTTLIVAQRISTILHADQIIVLDEGNIVGKGTHEELLNTCPVYQQIAKSQLSEDDLKKAREVSDHE